MKHLEKRLTSIIRLHWIVLILGFFAGVSGVHTTVSSTGVRAPLGICVIIEIIILFKYIGIHRETRNLITTEANKIKTACVWGYVNFIFYPAAITVIIALCTAYRARTGCRRKIILLNSQTPIEPIQTPLESVNYQSQNNK